MNVLQLFGALELGLIYGIVALAVYLTFRVIDFRDLTVDGSLPLGAAVSAILIINGYNPWLALIASGIAGGVAGWITGVLSTRFKIMPLLAGILTMTALYSVNIRIMGRPNIALLNDETIFTHSSNPIIITLIIVLVVKAAIIYLMNTQYALGLRAIGKNPRVSRAMGVRVGFGIKTVLAVSNGLVALAGGLLAQLQGFADVSMGLGTLVVGLVAIILGEKIFRNFSISGLLVSCLVGSIIYRLAISFALNTHLFGMKASDLNLITAVIIIVTMILPGLKKRKS